MADGSISRRAALGATAAAASPAMAQPAFARTFVLVHGSYHGGWRWRRVADILEARGHKVFAQSLTGLGDRSHLLSKDINLETHIADIANLVRWEDLRDICLVAHSYAGFPASGALEQIHDRVASIVWLDAFVPEDGQKQIDIASAYGRDSMLKALAKGEFSSDRSQFAQLFRIASRATDGLPLSGPPACAMSGRPPPPLPPSASAAHPHQIDRADARGQIVGDAHHDRGLAVGGRRRTRPRRSRAAPWRRRPGF